MWVYQNVAVSTVNAITLSNWFSAVTDDSAHGFNEMHRYSRGGSKLDGVVFSSGTLGEGLRTAMLDIKERYLAMIEGWER